MFFFHSPPPFLHWISSFLTSSDIWLNQFSSSSDFPSQLYYCHPHTFIPLHSYLKRERGESLSCLLISFQLQPHFSFSIENKIPWNHCLYLPSTSSLFSLSLDATTVDCDPSLHGSCYCQGHRYLFVWNPVHLSELLYNLY